MPCCYDSLMICCMIKLAPAVPLTVTALRQPMHVACMQARQASNIRLLQVPDTTIVTPASDYK
jgi:hypothetical protein